jgi:hypothetical protein
MSQPATQKSIPRDQVVAIRHARRYIKRNSGTLARILNAYKLAEQQGKRRGYLSDQ